jgi:hypothetical protein
MHIGFYFSNGEPLACLSDGAKTPEEFKQLLGLDEEEESVVGVLPLGEPSDLGVAALNALIPLGYDKGSVCHALEKLFGQIYALAEQNGKEKGQAEGAIKNNGTPPLIM